MPAHLLGLVHQIYTMALGRSTLLQKDNMASHLGSSAGAAPAIAAACYNISARHDMRRRGIRRTALCCGTGWGQKSRRGGGSREVGEDRDVYWWGRRGREESMVEGDGGSGGNHPRVSWQRG
ncbi:hypothetical protein GUJ93_ZPchr0009g1182 [Zizania palustris]|uniref:Uncharacterized protein n=1 Tax=Zizania palustris TaxID=103762 RepID=A0A8J5RF72_ZIZPA|nr:hypothetical protein GUJ93_ZPchr0009g1182 [Zizania palustris]